MNYYERERAQSRILAAANIVAPFAAQKSTCPRASRHLFDNEQAACMEASKLHCSSFNHQLLRSWSCKRRTASIAVAFAALEWQRCMPSMRITSIVALVLLLASCASSGLYNMSDNWCAAHLNASAARCLPDQQRIADKELERVANNSKQQPGPN
jgi:hypothetical protein